MRKEMIVDQLLSPCLAGDKAMYSRRGFLVGLVFFAPFLLTPIGFLKRLHISQYSKSGGKFVKQGWLLQEGDI
jgi:hypothetical protein